MMPIGCYSLASESLRFLEKAIMEAVARVAV